MAKDPLLGLLGDLGAADKRLGTAGCEAISWCCYIQPHASGLIRRYQLDEAKVRLTEAILLESPTISSWYSVGVQPYMSARRKDFRRRSCEVFSRGSDRLGLEAGSPAQLCDPELPNATPSLPSKDKGRGREVEGRM